MVCENPIMATARRTTKGAPSKSTWVTKKGLAQMLKGGVIMDVVNPQEAKIAEEAGAVAVMALERVPSDIRRDGGVARMSDPDMIKGIQAAVSIPVMAKARIGHHVEAQVLEALDVDYIDESEVLTPADDRFHIDKHAFKVPFVCGCKDLGEALRRINEGAAMMRTKGEAGTGFFEQKFLRSEVKPEFGKITLKKTDAGVAWGSVHWQYLEDMSKVTPYEGTPLKLKKSLYVKESTKKGPVLKPVTGPVAVGDELVVRIELRTDRDMEYVHLKDHRGSGTEPVNVMSRYKYQDGLMYYESTRDTASHFFIDYLPKGVYVFEYSTRVVHKGKYQTGMAAIQCMYAPEFNSHSESLVVEVK